MTQYYNQYQKSSQS